MSFRDLVQFACATTVALAVVHAGPPTWLVCLVFIPFIVTMVELEVYRPLIAARLSEFDVPLITMSTFIYLVLGGWSFLAFLTCSVGSVIYDEVRSSREAKSPCGIQGCGCAANRDEERPWKLITPACSICLEDYADQIRGPARSTVVMVSVHCRHVFHAACLRHFIWHKGVPISRIGQGHFKVPDWARVDCPICKRRLVGIYEFQLDNAEPLPPTRWQRDPVSNRLVRV